MIKSKSNLKRISKKLYQSIGNVEGGEVLALAETSDTDIETSEFTEETSGGDGSSGKGISPEQYALMYANSNLPKQAFAYQHGYRSWKYLDDIDLNQEYVEAFHISDQSKTVMIPTSQYLFGIIGE